MTTLDVAGLLLFVFYAVSFTKTPFSKLVKDPDWQTWAVRLWALALGIGGALVDSHFGSNAAWNGPQVYDAIKAGGAAAVGAIITYHIGQPGFLGVFDSGVMAQTTTTTVALKPLTSAAVSPAPVPVKQYPATDALLAELAKPNPSLVDLPPKMTGEPYTPPKPAEPVPVVPVAPVATS